MADLRPVFRLYRHNAEPLTWVLAYRSVVTIERTRRGDAVKFSWPSEMDAWFDENRVTHLSSKQSLDVQCGNKVPVPERYARYTYRDNPSANLFFFCVF